MRTRSSRFYPVTLMMVMLLTFLSLPVGNEAMAAFESGSTCGAAFHNTTSCRGAFNPTVNTTIQLPSSGILDYTTFTVPQGVTVKFAKIANNTPVIIRTSGNVLIEGTIDVSGSSAVHSGTAGDGVLGDDGQPGLGGPGGFDGGYGGRSPLFGGAPCQAGGAGKGPGGGPTATFCTGNDNWRGGNGGGAGYASVEGVPGWAASNGTVYGQASILPIIGGSGGGGGAGGGSYNGAGGGGGGGAILIASSGAIIIGKNGVGGAGRIFADGGAGGSNGGDGCGGGGGGGSGGSIKLVAETLTRVYDGWVGARRGPGGGSCYSSGGYGGYGRIRLEANNTNWSGYTDPGYSFALPGKVLVPNNPTLSIIGITAGGTTQAVPANPTGVGDVTLPQGTTTATVQIAATNIPIGTTVTVYVVPVIGANRSSSLSTALAGPSDASTSAMATVTLSNGNNVLLASATYTVTELLAMSLPRFGGEYVAKIRIDSEMNGTSRVTYITASGKEYPADGRTVKATS
ncbi:hypothetical protein [Geobacter argillaceus]|uniref:Uncharacterized protein n=1 Tax=Geobacter argillaceus TaxID=345631 RepID=A0A562WSR0_9BACT|nr:hypothetical protein [Geobacter argillaceus]TWJ32797.1 hypothetical protein JN12_00774 [Geobacter argillaceus]